MLQMYGMKFTGETDLPWTFGEMEHLGVDGLIGSRKCFSWTFFQPSQLELHPKAAAWNSQRMSLSLDTPQSPSIPLSLSKAIYFANTHEKPNRSRLYWCFKLLSKEIWPRFPYMRVSLNGGTQQPWVFLLKWSFWGVLGVPPFKGKHPYHTTDSILKNTTCTRRIFGRDSGIIAGRS